MSEIKMTVENAIRQEREMNKLREKLRKAEARAKQAENAAAKMERSELSLLWVLNMIVGRNGESRALPLIDHLWKCHKADMETNTRLRTEKAAWQREREELLEEIEQLKTEARTKYKEDV